MVVVGLSVWTSLGLHCKVGQCIRIMCILTNILIISFFILWATTTLRGLGEHRGGAAKI